MKTITSKFTIAALTVILFLAAGCERNLDDLDLATYPTNPEIFIDGFSTGLYYAAYGTSNVTAFSVDNEVKYAGTSSMKFAVPDTSDPNGSYVGGVYGTNPPRDLSGYNVLTFSALDFFDPEQEKDNSSDQALVYPPTATYSFGLLLDF